MQNKRTLVKVGCGAVVASGIAAGVIFEVMKKENVSQFAGDNLSQDDYAFMSYVSEYGKNYPTGTEYKQRQSNWAVADAKIRQWNANPNKTSTVGHNHFSSYSPAELKMIKGYQGGPVAPTGSTDTSLSSTTPTANGVDWVAQGKVTPVQN